MELKLRMAGQLAFPVINTADICLPFAVAEAKPWAPNWKSAK
jgi:hypothetical protein